MGRLDQVVFDCERAPALARFWVGMLDGYRVRDYDGAEIARLLSLGASVVREARGYTVMQDPEGNRFRVVQRR